MQNTMQTARQVHQTVNYGKFQPLGGNRNINPLHLKRLEQSMKETPLFTIITVNENYEVIDGQHRLEASKNLGIPVNYVICEGYGLREVQVLNATAKTWSLSDYLQGYCDLGYSDYILMRKFLNTYQWGINETLHILGGSSNSDYLTIFKLGEFRVIDYAHAEYVAERIKLVAPYYQNYKRRAFIFCMISLLKRENFDFIEFLQKLKLQPTALKDCTTVPQYKELIENIYNYRRKEKINLRY